MGVIVNISKFITKVLYPKMRLRNKRENFTMPFFQKKKKKINTFGENCQKYQFWGASISDI